MPAEKWQGISDARAVLDDRYAKRAAIDRKMQVLDGLDTDFLKASLSLYHAAAHELQAQRKMLVNLQNSAEDTNQQTEEIANQVRKQDELYTSMLGKVGGDRRLLDQLISRHTPVAEAEAEHGTWRSYLEALGYEGLEKEAEAGTEEMRALWEDFEAASEMPE